MMKRALLILLLFGFIGLAHAEDYVGDTLNIQYRSAGPLQIELTGPRALVERARGLDILPPEGCGFSLEWGDDTSATPSTAKAPFCKVELKHKYEKPGRYVVRAVVNAPKDPNAREGRLFGKMVVILN